MKNITDPIHNHHKIVFEEKVLNADSHIYHYAKGKYVMRENPFTDLRKIYAHRNGVKAKFISDGIIFNMLLSLVYEHIKSEREFKSLFVSCFSKYKGEAITPLFIKITTLKKVILELLTVLRFVKVYENGKVLIPLDKPNYMILPSIEREKKLNNTQQKTQSEIKENNGIY